MNRINKLDTCPMLYERQLRPPRIAGILLLRSSKSRGFAPVVT